MAYDWEQDLIRRTRQNYLSSIGVMPGTYGSVGPIYAQASPISAPVLPQERTQDQTFRGIQQPQQQAQASANQPMAAYQSRLDAMRQADKSYMLGGQTPDMIASRLQRYQLLSLPRTVRAGIEREQRAEAMQRSQMESQERTSREATAAQLQGEQAKAYAQMMGQWMGARETAEGTRRGAEAAARGQIESSKIKSESELKGKEIEAVSRLKEAQEQTVRASLEAQTKAFVDAGLTPTQWTNYSKGIGSKTKDYAKTIQDETERMAFERFVMDNVTQAAPQIASQIKAGNATIGDTVFQRLVSVWNDPTQRMALLSQYSG